MCFVLEPILVETVPDPIIFTNDSSSLFLTTHYLLHYRREHLAYNTYEFSIRKGYDDPNMLWQPLVNLSADVRVHKLTELELNQIYSFRVRGRSESGVCSKYSVIITTYIPPEGQFIHH